MISSRSAQHLSLLDISTRFGAAAKQRNIPIVHTICEYDLICANAAMFRRGKPCESWHLGCRVIIFRSVHEPDD